VLGLQLGAVQQHFIHVLMLGAWGEAAVANRITSIDAVDLPNALRIVDFVVSTGHPPSLAADRRSLAVDMPKPGDGLNVVLNAELQLDRRLKGVLASVERELAPYARNAPIELVSVPLGCRDAYQDWLEQRVEYPGDEANRGEIAGPASLGLDSLFASLMVMINQTLVHAFVHWHGGERGLADSAWEMSGAAMMHAAAVVDSLARRHLAPNPAHAVMLGHVELPRVATGSPEALESDRLLAERCHAAARRAALARQEGDLAAACGRIEAYCLGLAGWRPGQGLPRLDNPCVDFRRVLRDYVWTGSTSSAAG